MRFTIEQQYAPDPTAVLVAFTDPAFYGSLQGLTKVAPPDVIDREEAGGKIRMRVRYRFIADLPRAAKRVIDPDKLTWIDDSVYDLDALVVRTVLLPDHYPDRMTASATSTFAPEGAGTRREAVGTLEVRVPLVGGQVEKAIVSGLQEHVVEEAAGLDLWRR